jgi:S1-C subfamily serine protease
MKYLRLLLLSLIIFLQPAVAQEKPQHVMAAESINSTFSKVEIKARESAVKIWTEGGGHGSGTYMVHKGFHFVLTAQHVTNRGLASTYLISKGEETRQGIVVYASAADDIAVLFVQEEFRNIEPIKYRPMKDILKVGEPIAYSGYPSSHKLMSIRGRVAGYEDKPGSGKQIILHTYGWFGCSGSVIFNKSGEVVGVLWGVDVEYYPNMAIIEDMIWV